MGIQGNERPHPTKKSGRTSEGKKKWDGIEGIAKREK